MGRAETRTRHRARSGGCGDSMSRSVGGYRKTSRRPDLRRYTPDQSIAGHLSPSCSAPSYGKSGLLRERNAATKRRRQTDHAKLFRSTPQWCDSGWRWDMRQPAALLARPADEGVPAAVRRGSGTQRRNADGKQITPSYSEAHHSGVTRDGGGICASRRRYSQGPLTKAYPQRSVEEAERSDETPTANRSRQAIPSHTTTLGGTLRLIL